MRSARRLAVTQVKEQKSRRALRLPAPSRSVSPGMDLIDTLRGERLNGPYGTCCVPYALCPSVLKLPLATSALPSHPAVPTTAAGTAHRCQTPTGGGGGGGRPGTPPAACPPPPLPAGSRSPSPAGTCLRRRLPPGAERGPRGARRRSPGGGRVARGCGARGSPGRGCRGSPPPRRRRRQRPSAPRPGDGSAGPAGGGELTPARGRPGQSCRGLPPIPASVPAAVGGQGCPHGCEGAGGCFGGCLGGFPRGPPRSAASEFACFPALLHRERGCSVRSPAPANGGRSASPSHFRVQQVRPCPGAGGAGPRLRDEEARRPALMSLERPLDGTGSRRRTILSTL